MKATDLRGGLVELIEKTEAYLKTDPGVLEKILEISAAMYASSHGDIIRVTLEALNTIPPSFYREELINLLEGILAVREIAPVMDSESKPERKVYAKAIRCDCCWMWNAPETYCCEGCGSIIPDHDA